MTTNTFCEWMCGETAYAPQNCSVETMFDYWHKGVSRGDFSYRESVLSYLILAGLSASEINARDNKAGLQLTRSLGKATLNLVTLSALAAGTTRDKFVLAHALAIEEVGFYLLGSEKDPGVYVPGTILNQTVVQNRTVQLSQAFNRLQKAQDLRKTNDFRDIINHETVATGVLFISAATTYGLPQPGFSSGKPEPWLGAVQRHAVPVV